MFKGDASGIPRVARAVIGAVLSVLAVAASATAAYAVIDTTPPSAPARLRVVRTTETKIKIAWEAATDDVAVDHYDVFRDGKLRGAVAATAATAFVDSRLWPQSTHTYYVVAVDTSANRSARTPLITAATLADVTPPSAPSNLTAQFHVVTMSVSLTWGASTDNVYVDHYDVYRNFTKVGSTVGPTTTYRDSTPPANSRVTYMVVAVDEFTNNSGSSNPVTVVTDSQRRRAS